MEATLNAPEFKELVKSAVAEVLQERGDLLAEAVEEALADRRLLAAMEDARAEGLADRGEVACLLGLRP
ncbi:MAG TPA: hypothetical protein PKE47_10470 [Verrucomicrobiota bacterium]|nr:hypothetical protein [Verrucomicrobiota bacterium]